MCSFCTVCLVCSFLYNFICYASSLLFVGAVSLYPGLPVDYRTDVNYLKLILESAPNGDIYVLAAHCLF